MKIPKALSPGGECFAFHCKAHKIPIVAEYEFCDGRKWRFDFIIVGEEHGHKLIAIEIEGGIWVKGRHSRGAGMEADMEKYNQAALQGWRVFRFSTGMVVSGKAIDIIRSALTRT